VKNSSNLGILLSIACILFGVLSCDPSYEYDFYVENNSSRDLLAKIQVQAAKDQFTTQTDTIHAKSTKLVYTDESWGQVRNIAQPSDSVPAYTNIKSLALAVIDSAKKDSIYYRQDPVDYSKWQHSGVTSGPGKSTYTFVVDNTLIPDTLAAK